MPRLVRASSRSRRSRHRGQSIVEFALVIPIFLLILAGIMDFGFLLYSRMSIINAAREGARVATTMTKIMQEDPSQVNAIIGSTVNAASGGVGATGTACYLPAGSTTCRTNWSAALPGDFVKVTASYTHHAFFPLLFGTAIPMSTSVQMVLEQP